MNLFAFNSLRKPIRIGNDDESLRAFRRITRAYSCVKLKFMPIVCNAFRVRFLWTPLFF